MTANDMLKTVPSSIDRINTVIDGTNQAINQANVLLHTYQQPGAIFKEVTAGKIPPILDNLNQSLLLLQTMLKDVHAEREQLVITVNAMQKVLNRLDKTLQGVNNNPLIKPGIEQQPEATGIEMHD